MWYNYYNCQHCNNIWSPQQCSEEDDKEQTQRTCSRPTWRPNHPMNEITTISHHPMNEITTSSPNPNCRINVNNVNICFSNSSQNTTHGPIQQKHKYFQAAAKQTWCSRKKTTENRSLRRINPKHMGGR